MPAGSPPAGVDASPPAAMSPVLAVAGAVAHLPVKATSKGDPNRTSVKKVARKLEMEPDALFELLEEALERGALGILDGVLAPDPADMRSIASGALHDPEWGRVLEALRDGPLPAELVCRFVARDLGVLDTHGFLQAPWYAREYDDMLVAGSAELAEWRDVGRVKADGISWLVLPAASSALPEQTEGFVTPSLEVMVGPDPDPRIVARLALAAELVRVDRVLTFRLRPKSVGRGVSLGVTGEELVDVLSRIGRHGIPESVRAQVLDWAANARFVRAAPATVLRCGLRVHEEVVGALGELVELAPAPGVVLLAAGVSFEQASRRLDEAGLSLEGYVLEDHEPEEDEHDLDFEDPRYRALQLPLRMGGDPEVRATLDAERANDFAPSREWIGRFAKVQSGHHAVEIDWKGLRAEAKRASGRSRRMLEALADLEREGGAELDRWIARQPPAAFDAVDPITLRLAADAPQEPSSAHARGEGLGHGRARRGRTARPRRSDQQIR